MADESESEYIPDLGDSEDSYARMPFEDDESDAEDSDFETADDDEDEDDEDEEEDQIAGAQPTAGQAGATIYRRSFEFLVVV
jgi:hypothetical protein